MAVQKDETGIRGFDELTFGGLPRGRATLLIGQPGAGKTIFALQTLVNRARQHQEAGIFVAFEEKKNDLIRNADLFGWSLPELVDRELLFLDARPPTEVYSSGAMDLEGLLAVVAVRAESMQAKHIVLDGLDVFLDMLPGRVERRREMYRLHEWLTRAGLTVVITAKQDSGSNEVDDRIDFMQFMVDAVVHLEHRVEQRVSQRVVRVAKYRGSGFYEYEAPMIIGARGMEIAGPMPEDESVDISNEKISSGVAGIDDMLDGGYLRQSAVLVSGTPGTAKSTLAASFVNAACARQELALFVSFDEYPNEVMRNSASVGIDLRGHVERGLLRVLGLQREVRSAESHLLDIRRLLDEYNPRCLVIDPVSALLRGGTEHEAVDVIARLLGYAKRSGITVLMTSLLRASEGEIEGTRLPVSTIADAWIHVTNVSQGGERNRALTIVKARGIGHSNQVRELILSDAGISLARVYAAGGEVLMGTLRWEKEELDRRTRDAEDRERVQQRRALEVEEADVALQIGTLQRRLEATQARRARLADEVEARRQESDAQAEAVRRMRRGTDPAQRVSK